MGIHAMANREEVQRRLEGLIARLDESDRGTRNLAEALPEARVLAVRVTDLEADFWTVLEDGRLGELREGEPDEAHIRIRAPSDTLVELIDGKGSLFSAYLAGAIRIDASVSDLLRLRKLL
jgi:predicted DNA-binding ribbon-helix-helix protein